MTPEASARALPERRSVLAALVAVVSVSALAVAGSYAYHELQTQPTAFDRLVRCLTEEKSLTLTSPERDAIASGGDGAVRTTIEGNGVTIVRASDLESAARMERDYAALGAAEPPGRLERRNQIVYVWDRPSSPTQRQTAYDCEY